MAQFTLNEDLIGLGDGQIVRHKQTGQLGLLVEIDDAEDAEIGYEDTDDDDTDDDWEVAGADDDDEEIGARGEGRERRKKRRQDRREARRNNREDRRASRQSNRNNRRSDMPDEDDLVNRTLTGAQTVTAAGNLNITITPQDDFWIKDITASGLTNTTITMVRAGDVIIEDWPDGLDIVAMAPTNAVARGYGSGGFCPGGLSIRITGTFPGAGNCQVQVHGKTVKKTARC